MGEIEDWYIQTYGPDTGVDGWLGTPESMVYYNLFKWRSVYEKWVSYHTALNAQIRHYSRFEKHSELVSKFIRAKEILGEIAPHLSSFWQRQINDLKKRKGPEPRRCLATPFVMLFYKQILREKGIKLKGDS